MGKLKRLTLSLTAAALSVQVAAMIPLARTQVTLPHHQQQVMPTVLAADVSCRSWFTWLFPGCGN